MKTFQVYNYFILFFVTVFFLVLVSLAFYMKPLEGNLTRLGGFLENNYEMINKQQSFQNPLFKTAKSIREYDQYFDVVVLGDSFSRAYKIGWQNFLINWTGLSIITFDIKKTKFEDILGSRIFHNNPPRLFIYESIEFEIWLRNSVCLKSGTTINSQAINVNTIRTRPLGIKLEKERITSSSFVSRLEHLDQAANYIPKAISRTMLSLNYTDVAELDLRVSDLFSNKKSDKLLFLKRYYKKSTVSEKNIFTSICSIKKRQNLVEANGSTHFLFLPVPDKLSAYSKYLNDNKYQNIGFVPKFANIGINMIRSDLAIQKAIAEGQKDIYLPNDTHWSAKGHALVAKRIFQKIKNLGVIDIESTPSLP